jgi:hypothetical protein
MQQNAYFRVAVTDGWLVDNEGRYVRDAIRVDCGHNHRTEATAESCQQKLIGYDPKTRECSAKWYNSKVLRVDREGRHFPPTEAEQAEDNPGYCVYCDVAVPGKIGQQICPACNTKFERGEL